MRGPLSQRRHGGPKLPRRQVALAICGAISTLLLATGCEQSAEEKAKWAEEKRIHCLDHLCAGDAPPQPNTLDTTVLKLNGEWFVGPAEYFSSGINGASFMWWEHRALSIHMQLPSDLKAMAAEGKADEFSVVIFLRSNHFPPPPHGYELIRLAETSNWIASRKTLRPGLDAVTMKDVIGPRGSKVNHVTYYIATELRGLDGLPPVATCSHDDPRNGGGSGFLWRQGIWAGISTNQKHCLDWPEIYTETMRILQLLKKA